MKDWGYEPVVRWCPPPGFQGGWAAPVFHVYRVYLQGLT